MQDKSPAWTLARRIWLKSLLLLLGVISRTYVTYLLLGAWNRVFGGWSSVFYCYAGSPSFIASYAPPATIAAFRWFPSPIGVLTQAGSRGLVLASPVSEDELLDPTNEAAFRMLRVRLRRIAGLIGAEQINLAGVLPGVLRGDDVLRPRDSRPIVTAAVVRAVDVLLAKRFPGPPPPVILLGGAGYVGAPVAQTLRQKGLRVSVVDPREDMAALPSALNGCPALLVDLSRRGVIGGYIPQMWPGLVVLNETFPQPSRAHVAAMNERGVDVHHLAGLAGSITPPLPFGYAGAVPCCAAHDVGSDPQVKLTQLGAPAMQPGGSPVDAPE